MPIFSALPRLLAIGFLSLFWHPGILAQTVDYDHGLPANWLRGVEIRIDNPNVGGTPYLFDDWQPGTMLMTSGRLVEGIKINFVNQAGEVIVSKPYAGLEVQYGVIEKDVVSVTILGEAGDRQFVRYWADTIENTGDEQHYFYEVLAAGKVSFLKKPYKAYKRARLKEAYSSSDNRAEYVLKNDYFMKMPGQKAYSRILLGKAPLLKALGSAYREKAKSLMKEMKGKWTREKDVVRLLTELMT